MARQWKLLARELRVPYLQQCDVRVARRSLEDRHSEGGSPLFLSNYGTILLVTVFILLSILQHVVSWSDIRNRLVPDGSLVQLRGSKSVYLIENGQKRAFKSGQGFLAAGFSFENVKAIEDSALFNMYPDGPPIN